jgi:formate hydrogenlyase subunit 6/NADH:ubiquinone oxidoreductase subunit I
LDEDGELVEDDEDEYERSVMTVARRDNCIGCQACAMVCARKSFTHAAAVA